ncbi:MAG TPA: antibiotic biosynthesis monooxygenase [Gaiellaceae bacterium]|jgi:heme-degrading monooxygenase HmoA|nr:antibiotic biosynthesis monooxygenase [Gaiellaceae bacterium]
MYARIARYEVPEERMDEAVEAFREAAGQISDLEGLEGGYVLSDAESGTVMTVTLWESRAAMDASEVRAARLRQDAVQQADGSVASVHSLEVAVEIGA